MYKGADKLSDAAPRVKIKDLSTGDTLEYSPLLAAGKASFSLRYGGLIYTFVNASEAYRSDDYRIYMTTCPTLQPIPGDVSSSG